MDQQSAGAVSTDGWYPDPWKAADLRWWDGTQWTSHTSGSAEEAKRLAVAGTRLCVVDVETTGFGAADRVIEFGCVVLNDNFEVVEEWESLVNPLRDVGAQWVHEITATMLRDAPTWESIAATVASMLDGAVVVAHNLAFDQRMICAEFSRIGIDADLGDGVCTYALSGAALADACASVGIRHMEQHRALFDARVTAQLLKFLVDGRCPNGLRPARVSCSLSAPGAATTRDTCAATVDPVDEVELVAGMIVCFTGTVIDDDGEPISKSDLTARAAAKGLIVEPNVTKRVDLLAVADPSTQSGKGQLARRYGIPLVLAIDLDRSRINSQLAAWS